MLRIFGVCVLSLFLSFSRSATATEDLVKEILESWKPTAYLLELVCFPDGNFADALHLRQTQDFVKKLHEYGMEDEFRRLGGKSFGFCHADQMASLEIIQNKYRWLEGFHWIGRAADIYVRSRDDASRENLESVCTIYLDFNAKPNASLTLVNVEEVDGVTYIIKVTARTCRDLMGAKL